MKSTGKKLFIRNKNRNVYLKKGKYYYRYCNEYHVIKRKVIGGAGDNADDSVQEPKAEQEDIDDFIGNKKLTYKKIQLFENVVKYYKDYLDISILDKIKKSLKFLSKYNDKINVIIDMFKHDDNGSLSSEQVRMLITYLKKFIFDKIFVNYFIDIISIYYDNSLSAKKEIEEAMHMLTFVENDRKDEILYSQKINILLERLREYGTKNANELKEWVNHQFDNDAVLSLEYFEICDEITLKPMRNKQPNTVYRAFIAVHIRDVRLIDNIALN